MIDGSRVRMTIALAAAVLLPALSGCEAVHRAGGTAPSSDAYPRRSVVTDRPGAAPTRADPGPPSPSRTRGSVATSPAHAFDGRVVIGRRGVVVAAWHARTVGGSAAGAVPIAGTRRSVYAVQNDTIVRLDPRTGRVLAGRVVAGSGTGPGWVVAGALWLMGDRSGHSASTIEGLDPITLAPVATIPAAGAVALTGNARTGRLYVATTTQVRVIDANTGHTVAGYALGIPRARITGLATPPDGSRLDISFGGPGTGAVEVVNPLTGARGRPPAQLDGPTSVEAASSGGVWLQSGSGMSDWLDFRPTAHLNRTPARAPRVTAGGGWSVAARATNDVVWLGGTDVLACANPATGRIRTLTFVRDPSWNIAFLTTAGHRLFAYYRSQNAALVQLSPPRICGHQVAQRDVVGLGS